MGDDNAIKKYEDLLRPVKEAILKNWSMSLSHVLDDFIAHLHDDDISMNFPEAALLLQNSTTFYGKRVDAVFEIISSLANNVNNSKPGPSSEASPVKRRRITKQLERDDLEVLDFIRSEDNIDMKLAKMVKVPPIKQVVLNYDIKAVRKPGLSTPLFPAGSDLSFGYKEDFRIFGRSWYSGPIISEAGDAGIDVPRASNRDDDALSDSDQCCNGFSSDAPDDVDGSLVRLNGSLEQPMDENANTPIDIIGSLKKVSVRLNKIEDCEPTSFKFVFPAALKRRRVFQLPKDLIKEAAKVREEMETKRLKLEKKKEAALSLVNGLENGHEPYENGEDVDDSNHFEDEVDPLRNAEQSFDSLNDKPGTSTQSDEMRRFQLQRNENSLAATERAKNIGSFAESVWPKIVDAERRKYFSVHEYGSKILEKFPDESTSSKDFGEIVKGQPITEISRFFLATLTLANTHNIDIETDGEMKPNSLKLKLLSKVRQPDEMDEQLLKMADDDSSQHDSEDDDA